MEGICSDFDAGTLIVCLWSSTFSNSHVECCMNQKKCQCFFDVDSLSVPGLKGMTDIVRCAYVNVQCGNLSQVALELKYGFCFED